MMSEYEHALRDAVELMEADGNAKAGVHLPRLDPTVGHERSVIEKLDRLKDGGTATLEELAIVVQFIADMIEQ